MNIGIFYDKESTNWGPGKVVVNLKKGLDELGIKYKNNKKCRYNILLHGGPCIQNFLEQKASPKKSLIGPCVESCLGDTLALKEKYYNYVAASPWHKELFEKHCPNYTEDKKVFYWPCGIDTEFYKPFERCEKFNDYILYDKNSHSDFHHWFRNFLDNKNQKISYALGNTNYENVGLKCYSDNAKYCISANASETQGFGIMEIMSMNLPIFGLDKNYHFSYGNIPTKVEATSCPYFSEQCGLLLHMKDYIVDFEEKIKNMNPPCQEIIQYSKCDEEFRVDFIKEKFEFFLNNLNSYSPRDYILENHTLKKGAQKLIDIFEQL